MTLRSFLLAGAAIALAGCTGGDPADETAVEPTGETAEVSSDAGALGEVTVIASEADLPRTEIALSIKPSEIVLGSGPEFDALVDELDVAVTDLMENYEIQDAGTLRGVISSKRAVHAARGEWEAMLAMTPGLLETASKPAEREMTGVISDSYARAAISTGATSGEAFDAAFRSELQSALAGVDVDIARDELQAARGQMQLINQSLLEATLSGQVDPAVEQAGMTIDRGTATMLVSMRQTIDMAPQMPMIAELIGERLDQSPEAEGEDLWTPREVDVDEGAEVIIAVWDTGVDSTLQGDRMWVNPSQEGPGYAHGIAFGPDFEQEASDLITEGADYADQMDGLYDTIKGSLDLQAGLETPEKDAFVAQIQGLAAEDMLDFQKSLAVASNYVHGQHVADIAAEGNGAAKLLNVRFTWRTDPLPTEPLDEEWAEGLVAASQTTVDFLKANDVKVVNMSWRITRPMIEGMLQITNAEPDPEQRQARAAAIFAIMETGLTEAFASAPDILFVAGAGNEDENVEFVTSVPAGINLPNVITIGAVDRELQPAGFTSYGASIDLYANGFEVPGRVPGGRELRLSGTSMAAPQVANLAAKLWAVQPDLTVAQVVDALTGTATPEGEAGLLVVHPANALASVSE